MNQITFQLIVGTLVRSAIMALAGWLMSRGMLPEGSIEEWVSAVVLTLVATLWSLYQKYVERRKLVTALALPPASEAKVLHKIANGEGASLAEVITT